MCYCMCVPISCRFVKSKEDFFEAAFKGADDKVEQFLAHNPGLLNLREE